MLRIHEVSLPDGGLEETCLSSNGDALGVHVGGALIGTLPVSAIDVVMARYAKPLSEGIAVEGPSLTLAGGRVLCMLRHRARYDVIARDFLVISAPGAEPLAELATSVTAALVHLARAAAAAAAAAGR